MTRIAGYSKWYWKTLAKDSGQLTVIEALKDPSITHLRSPSFEKTFFSSRELFSIWPDLKIETPVIRRYTVSASKEK